jgi:hypothetical protein
MTLLDMLLEIAFSAIFCGISFASYRKAFVDITSGLVHSILVAFKILLSRKASIGSLNWTAMPLLTDTVAAPKHVSVSRCAAVLDEPPT